MTTRDLIEKLVQVGIGIAVFIAIIGLIMFLVDKAPKRGRDFAQLLAFLAPAMILLAIGLIYPAIRTTLLAFTNSAGEWIGLDNFVWSFTQPDALVTLRNTLIWVVLVPLLSTVIGLAYALIPDVSSAYWIFSVITTQVYLIMYLLMFVAAIQLRRKHPDHPRGYRAPMLVGMCGVGFAASLAALLVGFIPPSQFSSGNSGVYFLIVGGGALGLGLLVPFLFYRFRKPSWKQPEPQEVSPS